MIRGYRHINVWPQWNVLQACDKPSVHQGGFRSITNHMDHVDTGDVVGWAIAIPTAHCSVASPCSNSKYIMASIKARYRFDDANVSLLSLA
jgi:hypothetical protein